MNSPLPAPRRRGRPHKFGGPARVITVSLPDDVVRRLNTLHQDLGWAIVTLVRRGAENPPAGAGSAAASPQPELVSLPEGRGLIVVDPRRLRKLKGVSLIPMPGGRAFLALDPLKGVADLELAVADRLERGPLQRGERQYLESFHRQLREWRRSPDVRFTNRAIIVAQRSSRRPTPRGPAKPDAR